MGNPTNGCINHEKSPVLLEEDSGCDDPNNSMEDHDDSEFDGVGISKEEVEAADKAMAADNGIIDTAKEIRGKTLLETLENAYCDLAKGPSKGFDIQNLQHKITAISSTPYFPIAVREEVERAVNHCDVAVKEFNRLKSVSEMSASPANLSYDEIYPLLDDKIRGIVDSIGDEEIKLSAASQFVAQRAAFLAERAEKEAEIAISRAKDMINRMQTDVIQTMQGLNFLACMSQGESTITKEACGTETNVAVAKVGNNLLAGTTVAGSAPKLVVQLFSHKEKVNHEVFFGTDPTDNRTMTSYDKLKDVALARKEWISKSNVIPKDAGVKEAKMKAMEGIEAMSSRVVKGEDPAEATAWWFPNVLSGEVSAAQPVLFCLLDLIGGCLKDCDAPHNQSPFKTRAKRNQIIPPSAFRKKRIADFGVLKPGCFQLVMPDYAIKLFIEMKPVLRRSAGPDALDEESLQQAIGHLSKYFDAEPEFPWKWGTFLCNWANGNIDSCKCCPVDS